MKLDIKKGNMIIVNGESFIIMGERLSYIEVHELNDPEMCSFYDLEYLEKNDGVILSPEENPEYFV